jgi:aminoglycoside phosphotransferase (APT) family kinase protein
MVNEYPPKNDDESVLRKHIERIVYDKFGNRSSIESVKRTRFIYIGSYDCDILTVQLTNGEKFSLFLKDFRFSQRSKDNREQRRERELRVYRDLFTRTDLGMPKYYGSIWDESHGRFWLLLELVEGIIIKDHNVEQGVIAAGWLGRMQGFFLQHPEYLRECDFLIRHDARFFQSKAELAIKNVSHIAPVSAPLLARIVERYDPLINVLVAQPITLVHGAYIPWHILLDLSCKPVRVCPVDWELAALGSTLYDLAFFTDGVEPKTRERVWDAYRQAAIQHNVPVPERGQMRNIIDCFCLHRIFDWLSRAVEKGFSEAKVTKLVDQAEQRSALVLV